MNPIAMPGTRARPAPVSTPRVVAYAYRARTYPWALRTIAAAEAEHGTPGPAARPGRPCKCGCGGTVPGVTGAGRQAEYLDGHRPGQQAARPARQAGSGRPAVLVLRVPADGKPRCKCGYLTTRCNCPGGAR